MGPAAGAPAVWADEDLRPIPKNIYGATKLAAEDLCSLFHRQHGMPCIVLRTSRFFPERDDEAGARDRYAPANAQVNELLNRRVDIENVLAAQLCAIERAAQIGFGRYIVSATTPFTRDELQALRDDLPAVVARHVPQYAAEYVKRGWAMAPGIDRVYVNAKARDELGWRPKHDFASAIEALRAGSDHQSALALQVGVKGYHRTAFAGRAHPVASIEAPPRNQTSQGLITTIPAARKGASSRVATAKPRALAIAAMSPSPNGSGVPEAEVLRTNAA